jgi:hypothetical protein
MSILALTSNTLVTAASGQIEYNGQFFGTDSAASRAQLQRITQGTSVASTSGTSIDFTGLPAWIERITVMFNGVSVSGTSNFLVQLGDSGGIENTGYASGAGSRIGETTSTAGFVLSQSGSAAATFSGLVQIMTVSSNAWVTSGVLIRSDGFANSFGGNKTLSDVLDRIRITTVNGTDTFDAGTINIIYEG